MEDDSIRSGSTIMTKEEEEEMETMVRQRRGVRSGGFYGGSPPDLNNLSSIDPNSHPFVSVDSFAKSSGISEPSETKLGGKIIEHTTRLRIGYADTTGRRPSMEDDIAIVGKLRGNQSEDYVGIFDGHGGRDVSEYAAKNLHNVLIKKLNQQNDTEKSIKDAFFELNDQIKQANKSGGCTALTVLATKSKVYVANAGDSRAVLWGDQKVVRLTTDHKPDVPEEELRIQKSGGNVTKVKTKEGKVISRVNGMLSVSRAFGDVFLQPQVTCEPDITTFDISKDKILILGCDGLWDVISDEEAIKLIANESNPEQAAIKLRDTALSKGSTDNISVIVIYFPFTPEYGNSPLARLSKTALTLFGIVALIGIIQFTRVMQGDGN